MKPEGFPFKQSFLHTAKKDVEIWLNRQVSGWRRMGEKAA
jgi:hypothetical protein